MALTACSETRNFASKSVIWPTDMVHKASNGHARAGEEHVSCFGFRLHRSPTSDEKFTLHSQICKTPTGSALGL